MELNAIKDGLAAAFTFAILWFICSLLVWVMPLMMLNMSSHMLHSDGLQTNMHLSITGVALGLIASPILPGITAWLVAVIYTNLVD